MYTHIRLYQVQRTHDDESLIFSKKNLLEEVLGAGPEHQLLVDLHVELGPLGLQLASTRGGAGIRALE